MVTSYPQCFLFVVVVLVRDFDSAASVVYTLAIVPPKPKLL